MTSRLICGAFLAFTAQAASLITFQGPNAAYTYAYKINRFGQVAGYYTKNDSTPQIAYAYLRQVDGSFVTILPPDATTSVALALNNGGTVAGTWSNTVISGAFVRGASGNITTFTVPGTTSTIPAAINSEGFIAGYYLDSRLRTHGFMREAQGNITTIDVVDSQATRPNAINDSGTITGWYFDNDAGIYRGFIRDAGGGFTIFGVPEAAMSTFPYSINGSGEVAGYGIAGTGFSFGFTRDIAGTIVAFEAPGAVSTIAYGINDMSQVTGRAMNATAADAFIRDVSGDSVDFQVPGAGSGDNSGTTAYDINLFGAVTGWFVLADGTVEGFIRQP